MNVFLIGFMGSGKTTVGEALAKALHYNLFDVDALVEQETGKTIDDIFATEKEGAFRQYERHVLLSLLEKNNAVVSCGGGLPCFFENMAQLNHCGTTVYLKLLPEALTARLKREVELRPLLKGKAGDELLQHITGLLKIRAPFYEQAQHILDAEGKSVEHIVKEIISIL
jgi:shikimate kinase